MGKGAEDKSRRCSGIWRNGLERRTETRKEEGCGQPGETSEPPVVWEELLGATSKGCMLGEEEM